MKKEIENLLKEIANVSYVLDSDVLHKYEHSARVLLNEDFKEEVLTVFKYDIIASVEGVAEFYSICAFIQYVYCLDLQKEFLDSNFDRIDEIYGIVISEVQKQKEEEK